MRGLVAVLNSYFQGLVEKRFDYKEEYDLFASRIIERLEWHKSLALAAALFFGRDNSKESKLGDCFKDFKVRQTVNEEFYYHKAFQLYKLFTDNSIPFYPLKGPFWASIIYPDPSWRHIGDLDLIIPLEMSRAVFDVLASLDMKPITEPGTNRDNMQDNLSRRGQLAFSFKKAREFTVEIHETLVSSPRYRRSYDVDMDPFWNSDQIHSWRDIKFYLPPLEEWLLYLVLHGSCQHQFMRFLQILDILHFLDEYQQRVDWDRVVKIALKWRVEKALYHTLKIINKFKTQKINFPATLKKTSPFVRIQTSFIRKKTIIFATYKHGRYPRKLFRTGIT